MLQVAGGVSVTLTGAAPNLWAHLQRRARGRAAWYCVRPGTPAQVMAETAEPPEAPASLVVLLTMPSFCKTAAGVVGGQRVSGRAGCRGSWCTSTHICAGFADAHSAAWHRRCPVGPSRVITPSNPPTYDTSEVQNEKTGARKADSKVCRAVRKQHNCCRIAVAAAGRRRAGIDGVHRCCCDVAF